MVYQKIDILKTKVEKNENKNFIKRNKKKETDIV